MEYSITKQEIQILSYKFRTLASRLMTSDFTSALDNLKRLLNFIDTSPLLYKFINENKSEIYDMKEVYASKSNNPYGRFNIPLNKSDEISFTYQLLSHATANHNDYSGLSFRYSFGNKLQDHADEFNKIVVYPFIGHIISYLEEIMIDSGMLENSTNVYNFHGPNNGQINVSNDKSIINATININPSLTEISNLIKEFKEDLNKESMPYESKIEIEEVVDAISEELKSAAPKRSILKSFLNTLKAGVVGINLSTTFVESSEKLIAKLSEIIGNLS